MGPARARVSIPGLAAVVAAGLVLSPLLIGLEPVGADPDLLYRPIKAELARALRSGTLPLWSDHFGLGVPLLAESHAAALYPLNLALYGLLGVSRAYRLAMWAHFGAVALTTYLYARRLKLTPWGAALASVSVTFSGFQAIHAGHEPFYCVMPYLPMALLLADLYAASGRLLWLALLALTWGTQLTLGHFQLQFWTGGLALLTGTWRIVADRRPWPRIPGLWLALAWGLAVAAAQLGPTWELMSASGFARPFDQMSNYAFPPSHWAQPALPAMYLGFQSGSEAYWASHRSSPGESSLYVGTVTLILAFVGLAGGDKNGSLRPWRFVVAASFLLATLALWWPDGYWVVTRLPGFGWFRSPGRYTLLTGLGLALLAGHGLDRSIPPRRFRIGLLLAILFGAAAAAWTLYWWSHRPDYRAALGEGTLAYRLGTAALAWAVGLLALLAWRSGSANPARAAAGRPSDPVPAIGDGSADARLEMRSHLMSSAPFLAALIELSALFYLSSTRWDWSVPFPSGSPIAEHLAREPDVGLVAGPAGDLLVRAGLTAAYPYLGLIAPPPNYLLEPAGTAEAVYARDRASWMRRFGVTHAIREAGDTRVPRGKEVFESPDPALDLILPDSAGRPRHRTWQIVRYPDAFPPVWAATKAVVAADWYELYPKLSVNDAADEAWYLAEDRPPDGPHPPRTARVVGWDGREAVVEHDGTCDVVVRRPSYPGWVARVDDGPEQPVGRACGGLQAVRLFGAGTSRLRFRYEPTTWRAACRASLAAIGLAVVVLAADATLRLRERRRRNQT